MRRESTLALELTAITGHGILELEAVRQQLQRPREVVRVHIDDVGIQRVVDDRKAQRGHVQAELVRASRARRQAVEAVAEMLDARLRISLAVLLHCL